MGSDLHMSPPTPDEMRIVRSGDDTAVYARHTDGIYREGTKTWFRKHFIKDTEGVALETLRATHPGWKVTTLHYSVHLSERLDYEVLSESDRDWDQEIAEVESKAQRARERASAAYEESISYEMQAARLRREKEQAGG